MNSPSSARANPPSQARGLSSSEAAVRLAREGPNVMPEPRLPGPFMLFLRQFRSPFIYVLLVAAGVSVVLGQTINGIFIFAVLLINALIGAVQEYGAQRAAEALKKMVPTRATVVRDGRPMDIDTVDLVPGDYVRLVPGNKVPADIRLDGARELRVDESMLTGESIATTKDAGVATGPGTPLGERADICFAGTTVLGGRGSGEVIATGAATEIGRIAEEVVSSEHIRPPLLQRIEGFTLRITWGVLILIALIFVITLLRGDDLVMVFFLGVALAVSAIPEGLPAAITVALAVGMQRMARRSVIIRRLLAVEALGSCTYIASDKTGTLTVNEMTVGRLLLPDGRDYKVSGEGMDRHGTVTPECSPSDSEQIASTGMATASSCLSKAASSACWKWSARPASMRRPYCNRSMPWRRRVIGCSDWPAAGCKRSRPTRGRPCMGSNFSAWSACSTHCGPRPSRQCVTANERASKWR